MLYRFFATISTRLFGWMFLGDACASEVAIESTLQGLFRKLNIQCMEQEEADASSTRKEKNYLFRFQGGHFHLVRQRNSSNVRILFLFFLDLPFSALDNVRYACNEFNQQASDFKAFYSIKENEHTIALHMMTTFRLSRLNEIVVEEFALTLGHCFEATRLFKEIFDSIQSNQENDLEEHNAMNMRERYLAQEAELMHQGDEHLWRSNEVEHHYLNQLFHTLCQAEKVDFRRLRIVTETLEESTLSSDISLYDVTSTLIRHNEEGALFVRESATLIVEARIDGKDYQEYLLHLHAEDEAENVLYMRLTFVPPVEGVTPSHSIFSSEHSPTPLRSFLIAYDTATTRQRKAEFDYFWAELQAKLEKNANLTSEERFLSLCVWPQVSYNLYWGRRFFQLQRYYDALRHFENSYFALNHHYHNLRKSAREEFFRLAYYIGFCYAQLHLYRQAYYYLDIVFQTNEYLYVIEYVNALTNSGDFRAINIIDSLMQSATTTLENEDEENGKTQQQALRFLHFLKRRKSYILLQIRALDEAEKLLTELLNDAESEDFAMKNLLYIQDLRKRDAEKNSPIQQ